MFAALLALAFAVTLMMAFFFFKKDKTDPNVIITKLVSLNESVLNKQASDQFSCKFRHTVTEVDQIDVFPEGSTEDQENILGVIPYEHKSRILHYLNTKTCSYKAQYNKESRKLNIELIEGF